MKKIIIVVGAYGSGKSEYSANLAYREGKSVIVDLDIMNPYFRTRELTERFAAIGIEVVAPEGSFRHTELPMLSPRIQAKIEEKDKMIIMDIGGDPLGMKVLGRYKKNLTNRGYDLRMVVNTKRPQTSSVKAVLEMFDEFEYYSKMKITTLVSNTNLMEYTNLEVVTEGVRIVSEVAKMKGVDFFEYCVLKKNCRGIPDKIGEQNIFIMDYFLGKPWER